MSRGPKKRRSAPAIMGRLIGLVKPLVPLMACAVVLGVLGYLCAIFLTITAGAALLKPAASLLGSRFSLDFLVSLVPGAIYVILIALAVLRGVLHYGEQYCNHFIAFKLLAIIRHRVFAKLRILSPAKLEGKDKGNLLTVITTDIELLEVFYAHTISPICIAVLTCALMLVFFASISAAAFVIALLGYITVGIVIPVINGRAGGDSGVVFRNAFGDLNSLVLDSLRGVDEIIQYGAGKKRLKLISEVSDNLGKIQKSLSRLEGTQRAATNLSILVFSLAMLLVCSLSYAKSGAGFEAPLIATIAMMGSFGPVVALSNLSNNLNQTLAAGERVLNLLGEEPQVEEVAGMERTEFTGAAVKNVTFSYGAPEDETQEALSESEPVRGKTERGKTPRGKIPRGKTERGKTPRGKIPHSVPSHGKTPRSETARSVPSHGEIPHSETARSIPSHGKTPHSETARHAPQTPGAACAPRLDFEEKSSQDGAAVLRDFSLEISTGKIIGLLGPSGCGKSTLLKLLMRFWDAEKGEIDISGKDIRRVNTADLRGMESYVTQDTYIFKDTLAENIAIGKPGASREEICEAAKKASVHEFILSLPDGYDTRAGELGSTLSGGERQRIGIARAFLHDSEALLLDEPTSNLDSLNEGIILKALKDSAGEKTVVIVSHRKSTMSLADEVIEMESTGKS